MQVSRSSWHFKFISFFNSSLRWDPPNDSCAYLKEFGKSFMKAAILAVLVVLLIAIMVFLPIVTLAYYTGLLSASYKELADTGWTIIAVWVLFIAAIVYDVLKTKHLERKGKLARLAEEANGISLDGMFQAKRNKICIPLTYTE